VSRRGISARQDKVCCALLSNLSSES